MRPNLDRLRPLSAQELSKIHAYSLQVLETCGMWVESESAREVYRRHGCSIDGEIVLFPSRIIDRALQTVPARVTILAPNPEHNLTIGGKKSVFGPTAGAAFLLDQEGKQQLPTRNDLDRFIKLTQVLPVLKFQRGSVVYPRDIPPQNIPFYDSLASLLYSDKPIYAHDRHSVNLLAIRFGKTPQEIKRDAVTGTAYGGYGNVNPQSPLALPGAASDCLMDLAEFGIPITIAPAPMAGLTAPCTVPGLLIQQNAEILAAAALVQMVNPGSPVLYGCIGTATDMRFAIGAIGAPETRVIEHASAQIARFYGMPTRGDVALSDSLSVDFQAGAESALNFYAAARSGINLLPGVGAMGSWNFASFEKFVMDAELAEYVKRMLKPLKFSEETMAVDLITRIGPRGSYISEDHTFAHFRKACFSSSLFSRSPYMDWERKGRRDAFKRAHDKVTHLLDGYQKPDVDPAIERDLRRYVRENLPVAGAPLPGD